MEYCFKKLEPSAYGVRRVAREQLDQALREIDDRDLNRHEAVHQVRKRCKKLRGLLRLVRPSLGGTYREENIFFRDTARLLSDIRDAQALVECCRNLLADYSELFPASTFAPIEQELILRRDSSTAGEEEVKDRLAQVRERLKQGRARVAAWPLEEAEFRLLGGGLRKTYARGRKALPQAYACPSAENFHDWRKWVKYHWYHCRLLSNVWPAIMLPRQEQLKLLSGLLGDDHDLAVIIQPLQIEPGSTIPTEMGEAFLGLIAQQQATLRSEARLLGERIFAEKAGPHCRRLKRYWVSWRKPVEG